MSIIEIREITKYFTSGFFSRRVNVLDNISLDIERGEIFGYLGPNGAGKTTTLKIITGLLFPEKGIVRLLGKSSLDISVKERMGFLPENPYFYDYLTVYEYLRFCLELFKLNKKNNILKIDEALKAVELEGAKNVQCRKLSKGMLQRLGLAQALINDPEILILDEPLSGLDPVGRKMMKDLMLELKKNGKTIFLSSHIISDLEMLCDRIAIIVNGKIKSVGVPADLLGGKVKYIEIIAENLSGDYNEKIKNLSGSIFSYGKRVSIRIKKEEDVDRIIDLIREESGRIISINPVGHSLEDVLISEMGLTLKEKEESGKR